MNNVFCESDEDFRLSANVIFKILTRPRVERVGIRKPLWEI